MVTTVERTRHARTLIKSYIAANAKEGGWGYITEKKVTKSIPAWAHGGADFGMAGAMADPGLFPRTIRETVRESTQTRQEVNTLYVMLGHSPNDPEQVWADWLMLRGHLIPDKILADLADFLSGAGIVVRKAAEDVD